MRPPSLLLLLLSLLTTASFAVDQTKFRTCSQTGFCKRHRSHTPVNTYTIAPATITPVPTAPNTYHTRLHPSISSLHPSLLLTIAPLATGAFNVRVVEDNTVTPRWESKDIVVDGGLGVCEDVKVAETTEMFTITANCGATPSTVTITTSGTTPFTLTLSTPAATLLTINSNSLFHYEHRRNRANVPAATIAPDGTTEEDRHGGKEIVGYWEDGLAIYKDGTREVKHADRVATGKDGHEEDESGMWEEHFHEHKDSKPNGPMSVGFDVEFYSTDTHLTGIPEHAAAMDLLSTRSHPASTTATSTHYNEPYRLYNLDVFEYDLDVPMALYGAIPLMVAHDTVKSTCKRLRAKRAIDFTGEHMESETPVRSEHILLTSSTCTHSRLVPLPSTLARRSFTSSTRTHSLNLCQLAQPDKLAQPDPLEQPVPPPLPSSPPAHARFARRYGLWRVFQQPERDVCGRLRKCGGGEGGALDC